MGLYDTQKRLNAMKHSMLIWMALVIGANVGIAYMAIVFPTLWSFYVMIVSSAVVTLLVPYMFGEKSIKKIAAIGMVLILISGLFITAIAWETALAGTYKNEPDPVDSEDGILTGGTVSPYISYDSDSYTYKVTYAGVASDVRIFVNITPYLLGGENSFHYLRMNYSVIDDQYNITWDLTDRAIYSYYFIAITSNSTSESDWNIGPVNVEKNDAHITLMGWTTAYFMLQAGMLFLIGLLMYWWLRRGRVEREKWKTGLEESRPKKGDGGFKCTECGAEVGDDDKFCPKCGVKFDEGKDGVDEIAKSSTPEEGAPSSDAKPVEYGKEEDKAEEVKEP